MTKRKFRVCINEEELENNEDLWAFVEDAKMFYDSIKTDDIFLVDVTEDGHVYCVMQ